MRHPKLRWRREIPEALRFPDCLISGSSDSGCELFPDDCEPGAAVCGYVAPLVPAQQEVEVDCHGAGSKNGVPRNYMVNRVSVDDGDSVTLLDPEGPECTRKRLNSFGQEAVRDNVATRCVDNGGLVGPLLSRCFDVQGDVVHGVPNLMVNSLSIPYRLGCSSAHYSTVARPLGKLALTS